MRWTGCGDHRRLILRFDLDTRLSLGAACQFLARARLDAGSVPSQPHLVGIYPNLDESSSLLDYRPDPEAKTPGSAANRLAGVCQSHPLRSRMAKGGTDGWVRTIDLLIHNQAL